MNYSFDCILVVFFATEQVRAIFVQNNGRTAEEVVVFEYGRGAREVRTGGIHPLALLMAVVTAGSGSEAKVTFDK
jgi:hypothetical protein